MDYNARAKKRSKNKTIKYPQEKNKQKILTVCYGNLHRSRTAEWLLHKNYIVDSCGVWEYAFTEISQNKVDTSDTIVVMEQYMADYIAKKYPEVKNKLMVLEVEDTIICPELILELNSKLKARDLKTLKFENPIQATKDCTLWVNHKKKSIMRNQPQADYQAPSFFSFSNQEENKKE